MNLDQLLAVVNELSPEDREKLTAYLSTHQEVTKPRTVEGWLVEFADIASEFQGESSAEEMDEILQAMTMKSR